MISQHQYLLGMIPHHSMAVHMSKKLLEKKDFIKNNENNKNNKKIKSFVENIIKTQYDEITFMKNILL